MPVLTRCSRQLATLQDHGQGCLQASVNQSIAAPKSSTGCFLHDYHVDMSFIAKEATLRATMVVGDQEVGSWIA